MKKLIIIIALILTPIVSIADDLRLDDVYYSNKPIRMTVSTNEDAYIYFPNPVKIKDVHAEYAEVVNTNDVVIIKALDVFNSKRFMFVDLKTNKTFIFNISANHANNPRNIRILIPKAQPEKNIIPKGGAYISLVQHASMTLYYPDHYAPNNSQISRLKIKKSEVDYFISFDGKAEIVAAWQGYQYFLTALKITNNEMREITIDPKIHFRGNWLFLASQHSWLSASADNKNNMTTVYVISKRPFWESLL